MLSSKEIKAFLEIGQALGLTGDDLRKYVDDEKCAAISEKEKERAHELEKAERAASLELEKAKLAADEKERATNLELEKAKLAAQEKQLEAAAQAQEQERAANLELEKAKLAAQEKEREAAARAQEQERAANLELEKAKFEIEKARIDAEMKERERIHARETQRQQHEYDINRSVGRGPAGDTEILGTRTLDMRKIKMPMFNEEKDDLDAFLLRFERACDTYGVKEEEKSMHLAQLLQGKSLEVYERLPYDEIQSYDSLKGQLLRRFRLTEGGYRRKFR